MLDSERYPLTRRGWVLLAVAIGASALGLVFGARSLNAIVAPIIVAIAVAWWRISRVDTPIITRDAPTSGFQGEKHTVTISIAGGLEYIGHVTDEVGSGLTAADNDRSVPLDGGLSYRVSLVERGRHRIGPATITISDLLGLAQRVVSYSASTELIVYPRIHPIGIPQLLTLARSADLPLDRERHEFDKLREYEPSDSLRDVHWKTSAKRPDHDFIVKEFASNRDRGTVILSGESINGTDDALAEAMASLAAALAEFDVHVGIITTNGQVPPIHRRSQLDQILSNLAGIGPGRAPHRSAIHLIAGSDDVDSVTISVGHEEFTFGDLREGTIPARPLLENSASQTKSGEVAD